MPIAGMALLPVLFGWPALLFPMHIALLELIIDPACSVAFENEPAESDLMQRPPRDASAPLFGGVTLWLALLQGMGVDMVQGYHLDKPRADHPGLHGDGRAGIAPA